MNKFLTVGVVIAILLGGLSLFKGNEIITGVIASPEVYTYLHVHGTLTENGGHVATSSTVSTYTMTRAELADVGLITWTPNINTTVTLPATSTITDIVPRVGDRRDIWIYNASTTATASITLAAGAGIDLQKNEDTADLAVLGLDWVKLTLIRQADSDITVIMTEYIEAD